MFGYTSARKFRVSDPNKDLNLSEVRAVHSKDQVQDEMIVNTMYSKSKLYFDI